MGQDTQGRLSAGPCRIRSKECALVHPHGRFGLLHSHRKLGLRLQQAASILAFSTESPAQDSPLASARVTPWGCACKGPLTGGCACHGPLTGGSLRRSCGSEQCALWGPRMPSTPGQRRASQSPQRCHGPQAPPHSRALPRQLGPAAPESATPSSTFLGGTREAQHPAVHSRGAPGGRNTKQHILGVPGARMLRVLPRQHAPCRGLVSSRPAKLQWRVSSTPPEIAIASPQHSFQ